MSLAKEGQGEPVDKAASPEQREPMESDTEAPSAVRSSGAMEDQEDVSASEASDEEAKPQKRKAEKLSGKKKKKAKVLGIDDEAERSDDGKGDRNGGDNDEDEDDDEDDEDEDEEEDDGPDDYEYNDFVVQDASDVDSDDDPLGRRGKSKSKSKGSKLSKLKKKKGGLLDQEDVDLVRENLEWQRLQEEARTTNIHNFKVDGDEDEIPNEYEDRDEDEDMDDFIDRGESGAAAKPRRQKRSTAPRRRGFDEATEDQKIEANEIFGAGFDEFDDEDYELDEEATALQLEREMERKKILATSKGVYEYSQLVESFCLEEDEVIRTLDIPERYQLSMKGREVPAATERQQEARWMSVLLAEKIISARPKDVQDKSGLFMDLVESIETVLKFIQVDRLEVPFIWLYRRDYLHPILTRSDLWTILALDERWEGMFSLRHRMAVSAEKVYRKVPTGDQGISGSSNSTHDSDEVEPANQALLREAARLFPKERFHHLVEECTDEDRLKDVFNFLRLLCTDYERVRSEYNKYKRVPCIREMAEALVHPVHMIGSFLSENYKSEPPSFLGQKVDEVAAEIAQRHNYRGSNLLGAAELVVATELSQEPIFRGMARQVFKSRGFITTRPTAAGVAAITPFSEHFGVHYIYQKPLADFLDPEGLQLFMRMLEAEESGLITIEISTPYLAGMAEGEGEAGSVKNVDPAPFMFTNIPLFKILMPSLRPDEDPYPEARTSWDAARMKTMKMCVEHFLIPSLRKEIKRELTRLGRNMLIEAMASAFERRLSVGPFHPPQVDQREITKSQLLACPERAFEGTVAAIYQAPEKQASISLVFLDKAGIVVAQDLIPFKTIAQRKDRIKHFLYEFRPDVIVLNSSGGEFSKDLAMTIEKSIIKDIADMSQLEARVKNRNGIDGQNRNADNDDDDDDEDEVVPESYMPHVVIADDTVANIFKNSQRAKKLFPDMLTDTMAAVSLGRSVQEPLSEYCLIWKGVDSSHLFGYEVTFLDLHPLQKMVASQKARIVQALERKLVDAVCDVGVDLNRACSLDHMAPMLAFVGGLGLRKAEALHQKIAASKSRVDSRIALLEQKLLGECVWTNAAGFLRITSAAEGRMLNPLDNTRIHPELYISYSFTQKICTDALETEDNDPTEYFDTVVRLMSDVRKDLEKRLRRHPMWLDAWQKGRPKPGVFSYSGVHGSPHTMEVELNDCLSLLLLDEYAQEVERTGQGKRRLTFELIKDELRYPWLDLRPPLRSLSNAEMFQVVCRNAGQALCVGQKIGCLVLDIEDTSFIDRNLGNARRFQKAVVRTDSGLRGSISAYELLDERVDVQSINIADYLQPGAHVLAVLVGVQKERCRLDLSIKPSVVARSEAWWIENRATDNYARRWWLAQNEHIQFDQFYDRYFQEEEALEAYKAYERLHTDTSYALGRTIHGAAAGLDRKPGSGGTAGGGPRALSRVIHHPLFANVDFKTAEERLRSDTKGAGAVLVRPSSKGSNFLTLTWAFRGDLFKHISIEERGKRAGEMGLSNQLWVLEDDVKEPFSDLDELFVRYVEPMNDLVSTMCQHKSFHSGTPEEVEAELYRQHREQPQRIPYFVRFEPSRPGAFVLTWLSVSSKTGLPAVKQLRMDVRPTGYRVHDRVFGRPSELIVWFKQMNESASRASQAAPQATQRTRPSRFGSSVPPPPLPPQQSLYGRGY